MKKKNLLCLLTALLLLSSCGNGDTQDNLPGTSAQTSSETTAESKLTDILPTDLDFESYSFRIGMPAALNGYDKYAIVTDETGELLNDTGLKRNFFVEEKYNITLEFVLGEEANGTRIVSDVQKAVLADEDTYDMIQFSSAWDKILPLIQSKALYNLHDIPHINLDADYFYGHLNEMLEINGNLYTAFSNYNNSGTMPLYMVFNKNMMVNMNLELPYDAILNGDWTYDLFLSYIKDISNDLDGNGIMDMNDQYGVSNIDSLINYYVWGFDIELLERLDNTSYTPNLHNEKLVAAIQRIVDLKTSNSACYSFPLSMAVQGEPHIFMRGNVLFSSTGTGGLALRSIEEFDFGIAPFPKYDESQKDYTNYVALDNFGIPITIQEPDIVGAVLEGLAVSSKEMMEPAYLDVYVENKLLRDEESVAVAKLMMESACIDITRYYDFADGTITPAYMMNSIPDSNQVISHLTSVEKSATAKANDFFSAFFTEE